MTAQHQAEKESLEASLRKAWAVVEGKLAVGRDALAAEWEKVRQARTQFLEMQREGTFKASGTRAGAGRSSWTSGRRSSRATKEPWSGGSVSYY